MHAVNVLLMRCTRGLFIKCCQCAANMAYYGLGNRVGDRVGYDIKVLSLCCQCAVNVL